MMMRHAAPRVFALAVSAACGFAACAQDDPIAKAERAVTEAAGRAAADPARPIYHVLPPAQWINDPNGPIYFDGYYHLFYQHNPFADRWDHMHWGHVRSRDLARWERLPMALWPSTEAGENHCFSGCAALNGRGEPILLYTSIGARLPEQWAAVPADPEWREWRKHPRNPILTEALHGGGKVYEWRDPYVFHHDGRAFLVTGGNLNQSKGGQAIVGLYEARDAELTDWTYRGVLFTHPDADAKNIECPNFFRLGDTWVLIVSPHRKVEYFLGSFDADAGTFTAASRGLVDPGDYYAPNGCFSPDGRHLLWGWVNGYAPGRGWTGCLTLPRALTISDGRLLQQPAPELSGLRLNALTSRNAFILEAGVNTIDGATGNALEIEIQIGSAAAASWGLQVKDGEKSVDLLRVTRDEWSLAGLTLTPPPGPAGIRLYLDRSLLELYAGNGGLAATKVIEPVPGSAVLAIFADGGTISVDALRVWSLGSAWL